MSMTLKLNDSLHTRLVLDLVNLLNTITENEYSQGENLAAHAYQKGVIIGILADLCLADSHVYSKVIQRLRKIKETRRL